MASKTKTSSVKLTFQPKKETKKLLKPLQDRAKTVLNERFGLETGVKKTLESIGQKYGITRERVRQIENFAIGAIRKSDSFTEARALFDELQEVISGFGDVVHEQDFLETVYPNDVVAQNHLNFYLVLGEQFEKLKGDNNYHDRWTISSETAAHINEILSDIHDQLQEDELFEESQLVEKFLGHTASMNMSQSQRDPEKAVRWLKMSRLLGQNQMGLWGLASSPSIKTRGVRDYAYLILREQGNPMHFREVAQAIANRFGRPVHVATTHNELIKDDRFVLIGRGLYALKEWGYESGPAKDVIIRILRKHGPLTKEEVIEHVKRERYLKDNTILVNLQNPKYFTKTEDGKFYPVE
jgi:hypothetical protein